MDSLISNLQTTLPVHVTEGQLNQLIQYSLDLKNRDSLHKEQIKVLKSITKHYINEISSQVGDEKEHTFNKLILSLKLLRNLCAGVLDNQLAIGCDLFIKDLTKLLNLGKKENTKNDSLTTCILQLMGNVCVANDCGQQLVWNECYPNVFVSLLSNDTNENTYNTCCMVIYNCIRACPQRIQQLIKHESHIAMRLLTVLKTSEECTEWIVLVLETLLKNVSLQTLCDQLAPFEGKITLLEFVLAYSSDTGEPPASCGVNDTGKSITSGVLKPSFYQSIFAIHSNLLYLIEEFTAMTAKLLEERGILKAIYDNNIMEHNELIKAFVSILNLLCSCSSYYDLLKHMQCHISILQSSLELLRALSQLDGSCTSGRNRSHVTSHVTPGGGEEERHPLYGVKRDLVQIVGNLCHQCTVNQEYVHDFIPLILNQCHIDHYNPFIMQWGIWAIRNICYKNASNQELVRQLEGREGGREGESMRELIEEEFDCTVEIGDDGKLKLKKKK